MRKHSKLFCGLLLAGLAGCVGDRLQVNNLNNPDVERAFATPEGVEGVVAGLGQQLNNPQRANEGAGNQSKVLAGENFASVNNFGFATRTLLPRNVIVNGIGNNEQGGNLANFNSFQRVARSANNAIRAIDRLIESNSTLGSPAQDARGKAFAFMILGEALGYVAFGYDSAAALTPTIPSDSVPPLMSSDEVGAIALAMLDSSISIATSPAATNGTAGFPLPGTWLNGTSYSRDEFVALVRSYRARIRAGLARTPAQRAAVDWTKVIDDATNGITSDHVIELSTSLGWTAAYDAAQMYVLGGWHQQPIWYIGMADTSGNYDAYLKVPRANRQGILIRTPDTRWPSGDTRAEQNADATGLVLPEGRYLKNRPQSEDIAGSEWGFSQYDHRRYGATRVAGNNGPYTDMSATEISMLAAEGYLRGGQVDQAITLINASRTSHGLQAIPLGTSATAPIGTLPNCVPRVPQPPNFDSTACGTVLEAMKYEKRMETMFTGYMIWFTDSRGWGDLPATTPVEWPVPYQEMQARLGTIRDGLNISPLGTYGFQ